MFFMQGSGGQLVGGGQAYPEQLTQQSQGGYVVHGTGSVQDPRQQKLLMEHPQRSAGVPPMKPIYTKQVKALHFLKCMA